MKLVSYDELIESLGQSIIRLNIAKEDALDKERLEDMVKAIKMVIDNLKGLKKYDYEQSETGKAVIHELGDKVADYITKMYPAFLSSYCSISTRTKKNSLPSRKVQCTSRKNASL